MQTSVDCCKENQAQSWLIVTPHLWIHHAQRLEMKVYEQLNNIFLIPCHAMQRISAANQNVYGCVQQFPLFKFFRKPTPENWWGSKLVSSPLL